jgi:trehalose/maltose hydrolase-like predicted phosphorylase
MATDARSVGEPMTAPGAALDGVRYEAVIFDWDGTAVPDRSADASQLRALVMEASLRGLDLAVVSGTHIGNIDKQLGARPRGPGQLHLLLNRGSEVFCADGEGVTLVERREATPDEEAALDAAAALTLARLAERGVEASLVSQRLNRRKIDLIPLPEWSHPPKAHIGELLSAVEQRLCARGLDGLRAAVALALEAALEAGLQDARVTSDAKHVEIGLTDKSDSARWWFDHLWDRGIAAAQVLIVGDELGSLGGLVGSDSMLLIAAAEPAVVVSVGEEPAGVPPGTIMRGGGPEEFVRLLDHQLGLRRSGAMPLATSDPRWTFLVDGDDAADEQARESMLSLADGRIGTRGSFVAPNGASSPSVLLAGAYRGEGEDSALQPAPLWNRLSLRSRDGGAPRRVLELHSALLRQRFPGEADVLQFSSNARPGVAVLCALGPRRALERSPALVVPANAGAEVELHPERTVMRVAVAGGALEVAGAQSIERRGERAYLERIVAYAGSGLEQNEDDAAVAMLDAARAAGRERLLIEHRCAWAARWRRADVQIAGDPQLQLAVRLALYHLMGSAAATGEAAVGARGLTGPGYRGHVFWDADVFVLPFLAATHPPAARAVLEYRVRRLSVSLEAARAEGRAGARFAWESAASGVDVTPKVARDRAGHDMAILTGEREEHIVADVAWACGCYVDWSGDAVFRAGPGKRLVVETARYWASRAQRDADGVAHIRGVIGPDEYHELVDDNAYTNVMARWNLRRAFTETTDADVGAAERGAWLELADSLVDGLDPATGVYEQFAGFFGLEPLIIAELAPQRPIAADLLLGRERLAHAQVVKQADVLMLHHLIPDELAPGSLSVNVAFYEPRTAHGSSLSPGVHAAVLARDNRLTEALELLRLTARIDLDDISDSTAGGVHLAAMGSLWQALVMGFGGVRPRSDELLIDPRMPADWEVLEFPVSFRGAMLKITITADETRVLSDRPARVNFCGLGSTEIRPGESVFAMPRPTA